MATTTSAARQLSDGNSQGTVLGQSATDLIAFYNATPIAQRTNANQAAVVTTATTTTAPYGFATQAQGDNLVKLANEMRTVLVNLGLMKGS